MRDEPFTAHQEKKQPGASLLQNKTRLRENKKRAGREALL
jgi:hypothetical protein